MNAHTWGERVFRRDDASRFCGIHPINLDTIIHRTEDCEALFSERQGGARVFSPRDIAVLSVAYEIKRGGRSWLGALAVAFDHLQSPPDPDALLILTPTPVRDSGGPRVVSTAPDTIDQTTLVVPIGVIVADILKRIGQPE